MKGLSKSRYTAYCQCPKMLWLRTYKPELVPEDPALQAKFEKGNEVGELAKTRDYVIAGSSVELEGVKLLIDNLTERFGMPGNEFGLYVPVGVLMKVMVGSPYYEGNILYMESESPEKLVVTAELEKPHALLYAFREAFPNLKIDMSV